jgi:hypothetical protein
VKRGRRLKVCVPFYFFSIIISFSSTFIRELLHFFVPTFVAHRYSGAILIWSLSLVDANGLVRLYDLSQQAALTSPDLWSKFVSLGKKLQDKNVRVSFFSATPRGGGVALMRHALIRLWREHPLVFENDCRTLTLAWISQVYLGSTSNGMCLKEIPRSSIL